MVRPFVPQQNLDVVAVPDGVVSVRKSQNAGGVQSFREGLRTVETLGSQGR